MILYYIIRYIWYICSLQLGCHPVAAVQYTFTHKNTQKDTKQYIEQHKDLGRVRAVPRPGELYPGICVTTEEKARKNLSQVDEK
jgi:hypothetical protein